MSAEVELFTTSILGNPVTRSRHERYVTVLSALKIPFVFHDLASDDEAKRRWRRRARDPRIPGLLVRDEWVGTFEEFEEAVEASQVRELLKVDAVADPQFSKWQPTSSDNKTGKASIPPAPTLMARPAQPTPSTRNLDADQMLSELLPPNSDVSDAEVDALLKELEKPLQRTPRRVFTPTTRSSSNTEPKPLSNQAAPQHARYNPEQRNLVQEAARAIGVDPTPRGPPPRIKLNHRPLQEILAERRSRQARTENNRKTEELFTSLGLNDTAIKDEEVDALLGESKSSLHPTNESSLPPTQSQQPEPKAESPQLTLAASKSATDNDDMRSGKRGSNSITREQQVSAKTPQGKDVRDGHRETKEDEQKPTSPGTKNDEQAESMFTVNDSPPINLEARDVQVDKSEAEAVQSSDASVRDAQRDEVSARVSPVEDVQSKDAQFEDAQLKDAQSEDAQIQNLHSKDDQSSKSETESSQSKDTQSRDAKPKDAPSIHSQAKDEQVASLQHKNSQSTGLIDSLPTNDVQDDVAHHEDLKSQNTQTEKFETNDSQKGASQVTDAQIESTHKEDSKMEEKPEGIIRNLPIEDATTKDSQSEDRKIGDSLTEGSQSKDPQTEEIHLKDSQSKDLQSKDSQTKESLADQPQTGNLQSTNVQSEDQHATNIQPTGSQSDNLPSASSQADVPHATPTTKQSLERTSLKDRLRKAVHKDESDISFSPTSSSSMQSNLPSAPERSREKVLSPSMEKTEIGLGTLEKASNPELQTADAKTSDIAKPRENDIETQTVVDIQKEPTNQSQIVESRSDIANSHRKLDADSSAQQDSFDQSDQALQSPATGETQSGDKVRSFHESQASNSLQVKDYIKTPTIQPTNATNPIDTTPGEKDASQSEPQAGISPLPQDSDSRSETVKHDKEAIQPSQPETTSAAAQIPRKKADAEATFSSEKMTKSESTDELTANLQNLKVADGASDLPPRESDIGQLMPAEPIKQLSSTQSKQDHSSDALPLESPPQVIQQQSQQKAQSLLEPDVQHTFNADQRQTLPAAESKKTDTLAETDSGKLDTLASADSKKTDTLAPADSGRTDSAIREPSSSSKRSAEEMPINPTPQTHPVRSTAHPHVHWESQNDMDEAVLAHPQDPISKPMNDTATVQHLPLPDEHAQDQLRRIRRSDSLKHGIRYLGAGASEESQRVALHQTLDRFSSLEAPILQRNPSEAAQDVQQEASETRSLRGDPDESTLPTDPSEEQHRIAQHQVVDRFSALEPALQLGTTSHSGDVQNRSSSPSSRQPTSSAEDLQRDQSPSQSSSVTSTANPGTEKQESIASTGLDQVSLSKHAEDHRIAEHQVLDRFSSLEPPLDYAGNQQVAPESSESRVNPTSIEQDSVQCSTAQPTVGFSDQEIDHGAETNLASSHEDDTSDDLERDRVPDLWVSDSGNHTRLPTHRSGLESDWDLQASDLSSSGDEPLRPPVGSSLRNTSQFADHSGQLPSKHTSQGSERTPTKQSTSSSPADESDSDYSQTDMLTEEQSDGEHSSPSSQPFNRSISSTLPAEPNQDAPANRDATDSVPELNSEMSSAAINDSPSSHVKKVREAGPGSNSNETQTTIGQQTSKQSVKPYDTTSLSKQTQTQNGKDQSQTITKDPDSVDSNAMATTEPSEQSIPESNSQADTLEQDSLQESFAGSVSHHEKELSQDASKSTLPSSTNANQAAKRSLSSENRLNETKGPTGPGLDHIAGSSKQSSMPGTDGTRADITRVDEPGADESRTDAPGVDKARADVPGADEPVADVPGVAMLGNHPRAPSTTATNQTELGRRAVSSVNSGRTPNDSARSASATQRERGHRKTLSAIMKEADAFLQEWTQQE
ncbi:hypothetical protein MPSI1_001840 [Malassezia psittaci]|uniref:Uncharacterized protein n=1 Tax=Malassezia psittaci TaxID=1821823 RepID=A0AAF0JE49_9BASI|nr:hypothetical protein MPSI1_001840 [Malassezia psittaci]